MCDATQQRPEIFNSADFHGGIPNLHIQCAWSALGSFPSTDTTLPQLTVVVDAEDNSCSGISAYWSKLPVPPSGGHS